MDGRGCYLANSRGGSGNRSACNGERGEAEAIKAARIRESNRNKEGELLRAYNAVFLRDFLRSETLKLLQLVHVPHPPCSLQLKL